MSQFLTAEELVGGIGAWASRTGPRYLRLAEAIGDLIERESTPHGVAAALITLRFRRVA